jgi:hypothetical protein
MVAAAQFGINQRHPYVNGVHDFPGPHDAHGFHGFHGSHDVHAFPFHPCPFDQLFSPGPSCPSAKQ